MTNFFPTFDAESKSAKIPNFLYMVGVGGLVTNFFQFLMLSPNLLKSQIPYVMGEGGGCWWQTFFQLLMLSPNLLKSQIPYMVGRLVMNFLMLSPNLLKSQTPFRGGGGKKTTTFSNFNADLL